MRREQLPKNRRPKWRRAWSFVIPGALLVSLAGVRKVQQLREPISVGYGPKEIESRTLFERMAKESREHPWAREINVGWSAPWPKESGLDMSSNEGLTYNRSGGMLDYGIMESGWTYYHVEDSGIQLLAHAHLPDHPTHLSPALDAQLRRLGWIPE